MVTNRVIEVAWDDGRSSNAELTSDIIAGNVCIVVVNNPRNGLDSQEIREDVSSERYSRSTHFMSIFDIGLPTLPVVSFSGHLILVTMQAVSVIPASGWLRLRSVNANKAT